MIQEIISGLVFLAMIVAIVTAKLVVENWKSIFDEHDTQLEEVFSWTAHLFIGANQLMAISKWFVTDHYGFWMGLKELIWAIIPIVNITYVWKWWAAVGLFMTNLLFG